MSKMVPAVYEGARRPEAYLYRAFGLAAVAAELHLQLDMLEPGDAAPGLRRCSPDPPPGFSLGLSIGLKPGPSG